MSRTNKPEHESSLERDLQRVLDEHHRPEPTQKRMDLLHVGIAWELTESPER